MNVYKKEKKFKKWNHYFDFSKQNVFDEFIGFSSGIFFFFFFFFLIKNFFFLIPFIIIVKVVKYTTIHFGWL